MKEAHQGLLSRSIVRPQAARSGAAEPKASQQKKDTRICVSFSSLCELNTMDPTVLGIILPQLLLLPFAFLPCLLSPTLLFYTECWHGIKAKAFPTMLLSSYIALSE
ncbi:MAG: hypothetical protein ACLU3I_08640 [Acutalibacteraceae bacterium]